MKVVVDTNVWVSSLIATRKTAGRLVDAWRKEEFTLVISQQQLTEIAEVLHRRIFLEKYGLTTREISTILTAIAARAHRVVLRENLKVCRDPDDDVLVETALRGKVQYLVTGDKDISDDPSVVSVLTRHKVTVLSLSGFLHLLARRS